MPASFVVIRMLLVAVFWCFPLFAQSQELSAVRDAITNVSTIHELTPEEAAQRRPIRLEGIITFIYDTNHCFIQDEASGVFVGNGVDVSHFEPGDLVLVEGFSQPGDFAPIIEPSKVDLLMHTNLPAPKPVTYETMVTGREDSQWVEVAGHVRSVSSDSANGCLLQIASGGGRFTAMIPRVSEDRLAHLVDTDIRIKGVCATWFNKQRQLFGVWLMAPYADDVVVEKSAPAESLSQPPQSIANLMRYAPHVSESGYRVKAVGTVILQQPGRALFVQDAQHGLFVQTRQSGVLQPGDRVVLLGFPERGDYTPVLEDATWQKIDTGPEPAPVFIHPEEALKGAVDSQLVTIEGRLLDQVSDANGTVLLLRSGQYVFSADIAAQTPFPALRALQNGSLLRLTGVCRIEVGDQWRGVAEWRAKSFRILLRSPADIAILKLPPWWTLARMLWAVGILVVLVCGALIWVTQLRAKVKKQTARIQVHLEQQAALRERYEDLFENANDMVYTHDRDGRLTSINKAGEHILGLSREAIINRPLLDFVLEKQRPAADLWLRQVITGCAPETIDLDFITAPKGQVRLEISTRRSERNGHGVEVEGIARDVTERRRLEQEILDITKRERIRIGHDLHDGVCQQQSGIVFLAEVLADKLDEQHRPEVTEARRITDLLNKVNKQTRNVARGLFPVRLEENGLVSALHELAENTGGFFGIQCVFTCKVPVEINDDNVANHLYYIAQEAMINSIKHGSAKKIEVQLRKEGPDGCVLTVVDDGAGLPPASSRASGMGLRIMNYRARMIGAELDLRSRPGGGTEVICRLASVNHPPAS